LVTVPGSITVAASNSATLGSGGQEGNEYSGNLISGDTNSVLNLSTAVSFNGTATSQFSGFTGTINIQSGATLRFAVASSGNSFGSLNPNFIINGTLQPRNAGNTITLGTLNGSGQLTGPQTTNTGTASTLYIVGGNNLNGNFSGTVVSNLNSFGSAICFDKVGAGTQVLSGNNTMGGTNAVLAGTLILNGTNMPSLLTVFSGATLGGTGVITGPVAVNSGGILSPGAGLDSAGTLTLGNTLALTSSTLAFDLSSSPSGPSDQIVMNGGQLNLTNTQNYQFNLMNGPLNNGTYVLITGATNNSASGVSFTNNLPAGARQTFAMQRPASGGGTGYVWLVVSGPLPAALLWQGTNGSSWDTSTTNWLNTVTADKFYNLDNVTFNDGAANGNVTLAATLQPGSMLITNNALAYSLNGSGTLTGSGTLAKSGPGTLTVSTTNSSFTGNILLTGGTLTVGGNGASLGTGILNLSGGATFSLGSGSSFTGPIYVPAGQSGTLNSGALGNNFSGTISSGDATSVLNLSGSDSFGGTSPAQFDGFTGTINLQAGATLRFSPNSSGNTYGSLNPTFIINGTLEPRNDGNTIQLGAFSGSGTLSGPQSSSGNGGTRYELGGNNANASFAGVISSNTALAGSVVSVTKIGSGTLTLSGNNTYTGDTTITGGKLVADNPSGSATGSGSVLIASGATLAGYGSIAGPTTVEAGATLAPGDSTGTLTFNSDLSLNNGTVLQFAVGTNGSQVVVNGNLFLGGMLNIANAGGFGAGSYTLFTYNPANSLSLGSLVISNAPAGFTYSINTNTPGSVKLSVTLPAIGSTSINGGKLVFSGSGGTPGATFYVLTATNLASQVTWVSVLTNQFDANGNFAVTNGPATNAQKFYRLQIPGVTSDE
jgi:autotransporter-associated beta strand protein